jgi:hypothetical protein
MGFSVIFRRAGVNKPHRQTFAAHFRHGLGLVERRLGRPHGPYLPSLAWWGVTPDRGECHHEEVQIAEAVTPLPR